MHGTELSRVAAPATPAVSLAEMREHLRLTATGSPEAHPDDELVQACAQAALDALDGADGFLGRALVTQTWKLTLPAFPARELRLPLPPLQSVGSVAYVDLAGDTQTLAAAAYEVVTAATPGYLRPAYGTAWPAARRQADAVAVTYVCGYGAASAVPAAIRQWLKVFAAAYYEHREAALVGQPVAALPFVRHALESYRVRGPFP